MKTWKKNAVVASVLVFICAGIYLNWLYTNQENTPNLTETLNAEKLLDDATLVMSTGPVQPAAGEDLDEGAQQVDYFAAVRLSRQESRDSALGLLQEAASYSADESASTATAKLEDIVDTALCEAQIESLVIAKGYADCVAYMNEEGISVAVAAPEAGLQSADAALITDIVMSQTDLGMDDIHVIEVK